MRQRHYLHNSVQLFTETVRFKHYEIRHLQVRLLDPPIYGAMSSARYRFDDNTTNSTPKTLAICGCARYDRNVLNVITTKLAVRVRLHLASPRYRYFSFWYPYRFKWCAHHPHVTKTKRLFNNMLEICTTTNLSFKFSRDRWPSKPPSVMELICMINSSSRVNFPRAARAPRADKMAP